MLQLSKQQHNKSFKIGYFFPVSFVQPNILSSSKLPKISEAFFNLIVEQARNVIIIARC